MTTQPTTASHRPRRWLPAVALLAALALVALTWFAATRFQSPAQRQAAAAPPTAQPVLATITRADLTETTTTLATVSADRSWTTALPLPQGISIVTAQAATAGEQLSNGDVLLWTNDRPLLTLHGDFPLYRDLGPGDTGRDVTLVQNALVELGYSLRADGTFGPATAKALSDLYKKRGSAIPTRPVPTTETPTAQAQATPAGGEAPQAPATPAPAATPKTEVYLPSTEVLVLADLPAQVAQVPAVGTTLSQQNATVTLAGTGTVLSASIPGQVSARLSAGLTGTAQLGQATVPVTIASITSPQAGSSQASTQEPTTQQGGATPGQDASSTVTFTPGAALPADWAGHNDVLITLNLVEPLSHVLTVPQRAVATDATGASHVLVTSSTDSPLLQADVTITRCTSGTCALAEPPTGSPVAEGALVRVDR